MSISRSGFYYQPAGETPLNLALMRLIDVQFLETPWYGSRQMARHLRREGYTVGRKRIRRLMARMGLEPIYQRPLSGDNQGGCQIAVGTPITRRPPHRTERALLRHSAPTSGV